MSLKEEIFSLPLTTIMGGEQANAVTIPFDDFTLSSDKKFVEQVDADEREEKFIYAYTDSGVSENGRNWKPEHMVSIGDQVVSKMPVGYLGHIKPSDYGYDFPEPQIVWFGSCTEELDDDVTRLWLKGYLLPTAEKLETWIKTKAVDSISVYGKIAYKMKGNIMDIQTIDLKSIDIARKLGEGLSSGIVGLFGEMDATYEEVRCSIETTMRKYIKDNPTKCGFTKPIVKVGKETRCEPYVYCWIRKMYIDDNRAVVNAEYDGQGSKCLEIKYDVAEDDNAVTVTSVEEVIEKITYIKKKDGVSNTDLSIGSEMGTSKKEVNAMPNITIEDVRADKSLYNTLKTAFATEMATEQSQKTMIAQAGEMEQICALFGGEQENMVETIRSMANFNAKFVGEMSAIFVGEAEALDPETIIEKTKEAVDTVDAVKDAVGADDDDDVVDKVKEVVEANNEVSAKDAISEVDKAFEDKIATIKDEALAEFVRDDFVDIIGLKPDDIDGDVDDWKEQAMSEIDDNFDKVVAKYKKRLEKAYGKGKAVGEMNAFEDLGSNLGNAEVDAQDEDPDIAEAKRLGYGI